MPYSINDDQWHPEQLATLRALLDCQQLNILAKQGGGNSKVYCAEADGKKWAIKSYPPYAPNQRDRLAAECMVYEFLNQQRIPAVPFLKGYSTSERWLIIDWIAGDIPNHYDDSDINQAIQFIHNVAQLNKLPEAKELPLAAEDCLSISKLLAQINHRYQRLLDLPEDNAELTDFLKNQFLPLFEQTKEQALKLYEQHHLNPNSDITEEQRSLIPADFGFHNSLRDPEGKLYFFDFDYFGWDDPVKLLADILWHPKMNLTNAQKQQFIQGVQNIYQADTHFSTRFQAMYPLFGLRWVLILLNEFIPAYWQNRQHAGDRQQLDTAKKTQLDRAKKLLNVIKHEL